jgi:hypothetical protein
MKQRGTTMKQGCQMVYFRTKNHNLGKFWRGLAMEDCGIVYGHLVYLTVIFLCFVAFWYILRSSFFPVLVGCAKKNLAALQ